ncbi:MAG: hypothetical protein AMQ22_01165 [Candidatus Methanofastidiosum methylothiophilum]|uniref:Uncharacterized protein n=1 Tax=Candidatus Methanofastidiosum methylothiophilum TaxID=1705564 RepID=A0A150J3H9_9EURY|nr:MAG: hypothetical protein AMQ22_01165 [Candidatus Methanofastidiosum methylthiophilus]
MVLGNLGLVYLLPIALIDTNIIYFVSKLLRSKTDAEGRSSIIGIYRGIMIGIVILVLAVILF